MSTLAPPPPPRSDERHDAEALEALIEEARRRARRRRLGYAAAALAAGALGFYAIGNGGDGDGATRASNGNDAGAVLRDGKWRTAPGLEGGQITAFAVDPQHPETLFAATWEAGLFKSANGGRSWRHMDVGSKVTRVDAVAIAPGDTRTVYVGTGRGVFKTTDAGRSWERTSTGMLGKEAAGQGEHRAFEGYINSLIVDPSDADIAYAGSYEAGFFMTKDGGRRWRRVGPKSDWFGAITMTFEPGNPRVIYAGLGGQGVYRSRDGGATWQSAGLRSKFVTSLAIDPKRPRTIYAGTVFADARTETTTGTIFKTTDGGASWHRLAGVQDEIAGLAIDPHDTDVVYVETWATLLKTPDGGRTWQNVGPGEAAASAAETVALDPHHPETIYVGTGSDRDHVGGVSKSVDGGRSWRPMNTGLTAARVSALAAAPGSAYAAVLGRGIFKRTDRGWRSVNTGLTPDQMQTVAADPRHPANLYAGTDSIVFGSENGGKTWAASSLSSLPGQWPLGGRLSAFAVDPKDSSTVYALAVRDVPNGDSKRQTYESLLFKSKDGGRTWPTLASVQAGNVPAEPVALAAPPGVDTSLLAVDPHDPQVLYAGGRGVSKSSDGGVTWDPSGLGRTPVLAVAVDPSEAGTLFAGTNAGVAKSTNAGATWQRLHGALDGARVRALAIDPEHHLTVFAAADTGVFWSTDGGLNWHRFTRLPRRPFSALAVDRSAGVLYAGADGGGVFEFELPR